VLAAGVAYGLLHLAALLLLPRPASAPVRAVLGHLALFGPPALAALAAAHAARSSRGSEKAFWLLLGSASTAYAAAEMLLALPAVWPAAARLRGAAHLGDETLVVFLLVALLVRPDRPRAPHEVRSAVLEWVVAAVGGYFLVAYCAMRPPGAAGDPWFLAVTAPAALPGLWALALAFRVKDPPFRRVYGLLALGFCAGAVLGAWPRWLYAQGQHEAHGPWDLASLLPFFSIAAAALGPRGPAWVGSRRPAVGDRGRARLAVLALAVPPLIDLASRAAGVQPSLAEARTDLTLACSSVLSLLVALRVYQTGRPSAAHDAAEPAGGRPPLAEASEYLQFASGLAHELNNPLMAVAGWAELALRRGGPEPSLQPLVEATGTAAAAVGRLQQLVRSGRSAGEPR